MLCRIDELRNKQVVCVDDGCVLGFINDIELDTEQGCLTAIIILGRLRFFGLLGREEDMIIPWKDISVIGGETVLVKTDSSHFRTERSIKKRQI